MIYLAKYICEINIHWYVRRSFQQIVSIIVQFNSNKQWWLLKAAVHKSLFSALKNFGKFKWKHLHWSLLIKSLQTCYCIKKRLHNMCFPVNFAKYLWTYFSRKPPADCFWIFHSLFFNWFLPLTDLIETRFSLFLHWINRNQIFSISEHVLSQLSKLINIMNFAFEKLVAVWDHTFLWDITWNLAVIYCCNLYI